MALRKWLSSGGEGFQIFTIPGLGDVHIEVIKRRRAGNDPQFWEGLVHSREGGNGPFCEVLHVIEESLEDLIIQMEIALPVLLIAD